MIEVAGLTKLYGDLTAVKDLSFRVAAGEVVGMVGPNGAGKTTTLRSIVGIIRPNAGTIRIAGHDLATEPVAAKQALAFIPDEPHLFDYLTVEEHLRFIARLYGGGCAAADRGAARGGLAGGGRASRRAFARHAAKLAIACGLLHALRALLLDEPSPVWTRLDPAHQATIRRQAEDKPPWCSARTCWDWWRSRALASW
jgi:ABC-2 type transport system ATP-binding protein